MACEPQDELRYKRARFATRLPTDRLYTASHFWLRRAEASPEEESNDLWHVGMTKFAVRMLGELVEHDFEVTPGSAVAVGQVIGWLEGFKAASDLYCVAEGTFVGGNDALQQDLSLVERDPYGQGWIYAVRGTPEPTAVDAQGYANLLDMTIDRMQGEHDAGAAGTSPPNE